MTLASGSLNTQLKELQQCVLILPSSQVILTSKNVGTDPSGPPNWGVRKQR